MSAITIPEERQLVGDIVEGLEAALAELGLEEDALSNAGHAKIKFQKLLYLAVDWANLPVQLSWHVYGPDLGGSAPEVEHVQATALAELPTPDQPSVRRDIGVTPKSPSEYCEYFLNLEVGDQEVGVFDLEDIVYADLHDFLKAFYSEYADDPDVQPFRDLYLANVELQRRLWRDGRDISPTEIDEDDCREVGRLVSELHRELVQIEELNEVVEPFMDYTDLLEDVYLKLSISSEDDLRGNPRYVMREISRFYHEYAWRYVSEVISRETPQGIKKNALREGASQELQFLDDNYYSFLESLEELCQEAGLLPSTDEYTLSEDEDLQAILEDTGKLYDEINSR